MLTRRGLFGFLGALPFVGRMVPKAADSLTRNGFARCEAIRHEELLVLRDSFCFHSVSRLPGIKIGDVITIQSPQRYKDTYVVTNAS